MLIAVASQNFRTVTGHAGKSRRFMLFDAAHGRAPREVQRFDLPKEQSIHEFDERQPHPLDRVEAVIAGSAGAGFIARMAARGVRAVTTAETDPVAAVQAYIAGTLPPPAPDDHEEAEGCGCNCGH